MKQYQVLLILSLIVNFAQAEVTEPQDRFGAIAFARANTLRTLGVSIATAVSEASEFMAKDHALRGCYERSCQIVAEVRTGCLATAWGVEERGPIHVQPHPGLNWYGFGAVRYTKTDDTTTASLLQAKLQRIRYEASIMAVSACELASHNRCRPLKAWCTWDVTPSPSEEIREWITSMGGEGSEGIRALKSSITAWTFPILVQDYSLTSFQTACIGTRNFSTLLRLATECQIGVGQLDDLYGMISSR